MYSMHRAPLLLSRALPSSSLPCWCRRSFSRCALSRQSSNSTTIPSTTTPNKEPAKVSCGSFTNLPAVSEDVDAVSGAPSILQTRECRIYRPAASTTQSGEGRRFWRIEMDSHDRWENPLMGWASTAEPFSDLGLQNFRTKEEAIQFARKQGWTYLVEESKETTPKMKVYADNFKYTADKLKIVRTK